MANASRIPAFVNPKSGNYEGARTALEQAGSFDIREVDPEKLHDEITDAVKAGATRILVAGGDGTIRSGAQAIRESKCELAVLPSGTLNHFARDHGIPVDLEQAAKAAGGEITIAIDAGSVGDTIFLNTSSIGAYVTFMRVRERLERRFGYRLATILAAIRTFIIMPRFAVELEVNGKSTLYRTPIVFIGVGERELQAPTFGNRIENGRRGLHIIVVQGRRRARLLSLALAAAARGVKHVAKTPELDSFIADRCTISMRRSRVAVALDGEEEIMRQPLEYKLERDILRVVRGEDIPASGDGNS
ncbi:MAG TPA: diacylglycerol kinase family protein [Gemmatimonadaceae bacterium]